MSDYEDAFGKWLGVRALNSGAVTLCHLIKEGDRLIDGDYLEELEGFDRCRIEVRGVPDARQAADGIPEMFEGIFHVGEDGDDSFIIVNGNRSVGLQSISLALFTDEDSVRVRFVPRPAADAGHE